MSLKLYSSGGKQIYEQTNDSLVSDGQTIEYSLVWPDWKKLLQRPELFDRVLMSWEREEEEEIV